jgi:hypothetical protein
LILDFTFFWEYAMTATLNNNVNNRQRRSLNDTIGHLDQMIDGLSEAIPGTIRDTLQESVGAAITEGVRAALLEIVTNPDILTLLRGSLPVAAPLAVPVAPGTPHVSLVRSLLAKACSGVGTAARWVKTGLLAVTSTVARSTRAVLNQLAALRERLRSLRQARRPLLLALAVGGVAVVITLVAPTWVAAIVSGLGGAGVTLAVQAGLWLRKNLGTLLATGN